MKDTQENNKLIMSFMEVSPMLIGPDQYVLSDTPNFTCIHDTPEKCIDSYAEYAKYPTSWDWLIPVIEKARWLAYERFDLGSDEIIHVEDEILHPDYTLADFLNDDIESMYKRTVELITFLNENHES